ncbi:MAG: membrane bound O-acyl transferase family-domain-containing protein [Planctomycetes bacterium]|nr:membrane bound O-acyl transferase family-domain-containing protein [Planctomycetota bacterium]
MTGYGVQNFGALIACAACGAGAIAAGFLLQRAKPGVLTRLASWAVAVAAPYGAHWLTLREPDGIRMLAICSVLLCSMKAIVGVEARVGGETPLPPVRWLMFASWAGMRPWIFAIREQPDIQAAKGYISRGLIFIGAGFALVVGSYPLWRMTGEKWPPTFTLMFGLSFILHFGLFSLLAGGWQAAGFTNVKPLFRAPWASRSLSEFWARRWNLAFSEMVQLSVYRPFANRVGPGGAAFAGFLLSGLLHELAISLPVRAGFGLPLLFFALHGALVLIEKQLERKGHAIQAKPTLGRIWTFGWLLIPAPLLFHEPFLRGVIWPIAGIR